MAKPLGRMALETRAWDTTLVRLYLGLPAPAESTRTMSPAVVGGRGDCRLPTAIRDRQLLGQVAIELAEDVACEALGYLNLR